MKFAPCLLLLSLLWSSAAVAVVRDAAVRVCFNYGCAHERVARFEADALAAVLAELRTSGSAAQERQALAVAVGRLYRLAARDTPIAADRAGNYLDAEVEGRMDCIDHSTTTTRLLELIAAQGGMRFHRVLEPARRARFIFQHFSAVIETLAEEAVPQAAPARVRHQVGDGLFFEYVDDAAAAATRRRYVVDSWFVDNGEAAVVLPLAEWLEGGGPNVR